jgi:acyl-CoA thioester hydrolase
MSQADCSRFYAWQVRVYWEDTDASGVVYYANYLKFMERARSEWLRKLGFDQNQLRDEQGVFFVVRRAMVDYLKPALFDDLLKVTAELKRAGGASLIVRQNIERDVLLTQAEITLACVDAKSFKPVKIPDQMLQAMQD